MLQKESVNDFVEQHASSECAFWDWLVKIKYADWTQPGDIKKTFGSADLLGQGSNRVIFDVGGNQFRMICKYGFGDNQIHLFVNWIGTHAIYYKVCKKDLQFIISKYSVNGQFKIQSNLE